jgi:hypothetical protein
LGPENPYNRTAPTAAAILGCIFFFLAGCAFTPLLGIQNDEALAGGGVYAGTGLAYWRWAFGYHVPVMLMSYLGALKTWISAAVFLFWPPTAASIRIPMLAAGAATVWLFFVLVRRVSSMRAAVLGCLLLATDATFLLTTCFDWGPVAMQHLLITSGVLLLVIFAQNGRLAPLAGAFFLFGLALWDKALSCWMFAGISLALITVYGREAMRLVSPVRVVAASAAFAMGALPFLLFNLNPSRRWETFRSNTSWEWDRRMFLGKAQQLQYSIEGTTLVGWLVREDWDVRGPLPPRSVLQKTSAWVNRAAGSPRRNLQGYAFLVALGLFPWLWWRRGWKGEVRVMAAALVCFVTAWLLMAFTRNAGGAAHHTGLLWPAPHLFIAVSLAAASLQVPRGGGVLAAVGAVLIASNLLVVNRYYDHAVRNGGALNWTDAMFPLGRFVQQVPATVVYATDWGILDSLRLLSRGRLPLEVGSDPVSKPSLDEADRAVVRHWVTDPAHIFVGHTEGNEFFPGSRKNLLTTAESLGLRREMLQVIHDRHGRAMFEVFRFVR